MSCPSMMKGNDSSRPKMNGDSNTKVLKKWDVLRDMDGKQSANIKYFHAFQTLTGNEKYTAASALFQTSNDEVFGIGYNNEDNLLALSGHEFGKAVVMKRPRKIVGLSGIKIIKIVVSERFGAAVTEDGRLMYWGVDMESLRWEVHDRKYVDLPHEPRENYKVVDMVCGAHSMTLLTDDKEVLIWGWVNLYYSRFYKFYKVSLNRNVRGLAAGWYHVAMLDEKGEARTFGYGSVGQLGYGRDGHDYTTLRKVPLPNRCIKVECGAYSTLFLLNNGELYACGSNSPSEHLCVGKTGYVISPVKVLLDYNIGDIAATYGWSSGRRQSLFSASTKTHAKYFKWGNDSTLEKPKIADGAHNLFDIFANFRTPQSLGKLVQDEVVVLSDRTEIPVSLRGSVPNKSILEHWLIFDAPDEGFINKIRYFTVFEGTDFRSWILGAFIITTDDEVYGWGYNGGEIQRTLGIGSDEKVIETPTKVENLSGRNIKKIVVNMLIGGLALSNDGILYVWNGLSLPQPEQTLIGKTVVDVTCGLIFYLYQLANSEVYLVSLNGKRSTDFSEANHLLISVPGKERVVKIAAGNRHFLVLTNESHVYAFAFGVGPYGTLGEEWEEYDDSPMRRLKLNSFGPCKSIMGGQRYSFCLTNEGELYKIGYTYYLDWPAFKQTRVVYKPEKVFVDEEVVDIASTYLFGNRFALETVSGKIYKWSESDENLEEQVDAKWLVEAFEENATPPSLSMVRLSSLESDMDDDYGSVTPHQNTFFTDPLYSDVTIMLKDGEVPGHKAVLHTKSAFFRKPLSSNEFLNRDELDFKSFNPKAVRALLKYVYDLPIGQLDNSLNDMLDFRKLALEDGNSDLIDEAERIMVESMVWDRH